MNLNFDNLSWCEIILIAIVGVSALVGLFLLDAWILSLAWNWVMVSVFSFPALNLSHAASILIISDILIGHPIASAGILRNI